MRTDGKLTIITRDTQTIAVQHIDNGGTTFTYDSDTRELTITTTYFGYGQTTVTLPFVNPSELELFFKQCT